MITPHRRNSRGALGLHGFYAVDGPASRPNLLHSYVGSRVALPATERHPLFGGSNLRFWTINECESWLAVMHRTRPSRTNEPSIPFPKTASRCLYSARWIAQNVGYRRPTLLWVTESDVWDSNWHLYYRLRQSYQDFRLIDEAPGHYFLGHESDDLASFIQLVMVNGWDAYLLTEIDYINAFFSHDGFTDVFSNNKALMDEFCKHAGDAQRAAE